MPAPALLVAADGGSCSSCLVSPASRWWLIIPVIAITFVLAGLRWWSARRRDRHDAER